MYQEFPRNDHLVTTSLLSSTASFAVSPVLRVPSSIFSATASSTLLWIRQGQCHPGQTDRTGKTADGEGRKRRAKMREDRAVLPHFLLFLRNAESSSANLRAFVEMPLRRVKPLYVQDSMLLYSRKCFLSSWFSPSTSSVISASSTVSGETFTSVLPFRFTPRMLTP